MTDNLLNEVDADLRAERMHQLWLRHRFTLLLAVVAIILASAGSTLWQNYQEKRGGEQLLAFRNAQALYEKGETQKAAEGFAALTSHTNGRDP